MQVNQKRILLSPLDPVHDVGLRMLKKQLDERGHETILLSTDLDNSEIIAQGLYNQVDVVLLSRSIGYGVSELLSDFIDLAEASGLREKAKIAIGGRAIKPELAAELGFDAVFGPHSDMEEAIAFVEGRNYEPFHSHNQTVQKKDILAGHNYDFHLSEIEKLLQQIVDMLLRNVEGQTSPAVERARIREEMFNRCRQNGDDVSFNDRGDMAHLWKEYFKFCEEGIIKSYKNGVFPLGIRSVTSAEINSLEELLVGYDQDDVFPRLANFQLPMVWIQFGTGCPTLDVVHIKTSESWGAEGVIHIDSSKGARMEGLMEGYLAQQGDGSLITAHNFRLLKRVLGRNTKFLVRAHRGLNSPETVLTGALAGADYTKLNIFYGSLHGGTDPERLVVDTVESIKLAAKYNLPFDIPANDELSGVATAKSFAGILIMLALGVRLGAKPILKPLFCYSPDIMLKGYMENNYVDYNAAKVAALQKIVDAPVWAGEPVGFMTHEEDRAQSCISTALHAAMAKSLGIRYLTIASSDEAYAGGPISVPSKIDTLRSVAEAFRFLGDCKINPTQQLELYTEKLIEDIRDILKNAVDTQDFLQALYNGVFGEKSEGASPGINGRNTVFKGGI